VTFPVETYRAVIRGERRGPLASLARAGLRIASWPYGLAVRLRNRRYDRGRRTIHRAAVPVVSVGNLSLGGTGKTPCVEYVARFYRDLGIRVAILSRGYGANAGPNDEALVLEQNLPDVPHLQGADRSSLADAAVEELDAELLVLDDGFQHRRLHRDLDIVLIDATSPPHRDALFPRGTLREPVSSLKRADVILLTRCDQVSEAELKTIRDWLSQRASGVPIATSVHGVACLGKIIPGKPGEMSGNILKGQTVAAFCGIGNPGSFRKTVEGLGATVTAFREFTDHHAYTRTDVESLREWVAQFPADTWILTTQKDQVKLRLPELAGRELWAVEIGLQVKDGDAAFHEALRRIAPSSDE
jgi:tetraacyldisaccharide 4'-kinase